MATILNKSGKNSKGAKVPPLPQAPSVVISTEKDIRTRENAVFNSMEMSLPIQDPAIRRRESHNEVERRRRDTINTAIATIATLVPECSDPKDKKMNKGLILNKAALYIHKLEVENEELKMNGSQGNDSKAVKTLKDKLEKLTKENKELRAKLNAQEPKTTTKGRKRAKKED